MNKEKKSFKGQQKDKGNHKMNYKVKVEGDNANEDKPYKKKEMPNKGNWKKNHKNNRDVKIEEESGNQGKPYKKQKISNKENGIKIEHNENKKKPHFNKKTQDKINSKENKTKGKTEKSDNANPKEVKPAKFVELQKINHLYSELLSKVKIKEDPVDSRNKFRVIDDILKIISGILLKVVHKRVAGRVIQACLKHGNKDQKKIIVDAFANDKFIELSKSEYGHFLAIKLRKYLNKDQKEYIANLIFKNIEAFLVQHESSKVVQKFLEEMPCKKQLKEYFEPIINVDINDPNNHEKLENMALKIVEKKTYVYPLQQRILQKALKILIDTERDKLLDQLEPDFLSFIHTKEGAALSCELIDYYSAKSRRNILKLFKGKVAEVLNVENTHSNIVIIKIFTSVDDTVLVNKTILQELNKNLETLMSNPHVPELYLAIFDRKTNYLEKYKIEKSDFTTSKKDDDLRRNELISYCITSLVNHCSFEIRKNLIDPKICKLIGCLIHEILNNEDDSNNDENDSFKFIETIIKKITQDYSDKTRKNDEDPLISHSITHRFVKNFVVEYGSYSGSHKDFYQAQIEKLYEFILPELAILVNTKAIFIIIAFIEFTDYKDQILAELNSIKHVLNKINKSNNKNSGIHILMKHLQDE